MDKLYGLIQDINPKEICNHIENGNFAEWCNAWRIAAKEALQPKTNADRIRAMSDEELAEDYCKTILKVMQYYGIKNTGILEDAVRARLEWLKQPAEEGDGNG